MRPILTLLGAGATLLLAAPTALAQDAGVEDIIVTAQKRSENLQSVPISISALSSQTLERAAVMTIDSVPSLAPGFTLSNIGSGFVSYSYIRGAGTNVIDAGADPSVAYFVDEVYLAGTAGLAFDFLDLDRIEVLKGPQGTLFGRNAAAGAISIITRRPEDQFNAYASLDAGSDDYVALRGGITGPLSSDGVWRYRLSGAHREHGAYSENHMPGVRDPNTLDNYTGRGQLQYAGTNLMALLTVDYFTSDNGMTPQFISTANAAAIVAPSFVFTPGQTFYDRRWNINGFERQDMSAVSGRIEWELPFGTLTSISAFRDNEFHRLQDQDGTEANAYSLESLETDETFSQEVRLSGDSDRLNWTAGLYYYHNETDRGDILATGGDFVAAPFRNRTARFHNIITTDSYAAFGQLTYNLTDDFSATIGARYTEEEKESVQNTTPLSLVPFALRLTPSWDSFDPAVTFSYQASPDAMIYFSARQGFKSGGFQSLPGAAAIGSIVYAPERVISYEFGAKTRWFDDRLQMNMALFRAEMTDQQILTIPAPTTTFINNAGKTVTDGIDLSITAQVSPQFRIDWNSTLQAARFEEYACATCTPAYNFNGNQQIRSPDFMTSLVAEYTQPLGNSGELRLRGDISHQSDTFFDAGHQKTRGYYQPAYSLVNARITYEAPGGQWDISVYGKNLTDEEYFRNIVAVSGVTGVGTPGDPLTFGVSLNWRM